MGDNPIKTNTEPSCKLTMFPANEGDCFLLEFGTGEDAFRMMIDSGTVGFGHSVLKPYLKNNHFKEKDKMIDLLLITHFDGDHIGGALSLLRTKKYAKLIKEVWHNGMIQIKPDLPTDTDDYSRRRLKGINESIVSVTPANTGGTSAEQSKTLSKLLKEQQGDQVIIVNGISDGAAITADIGSKTIGPNKNIEVHFLLPQRSNLDDLLTYFEDLLPPGVEISAAEECQECFDKKMPMEQESRCFVEPCAADSYDIAMMKEWVEQIEKDGWDKDTSKTNASSISVIICYNGKKLLFAGDAWGSDLSKALKEWSEKNNKDLYFDVVKIPHHGSNRNCLELLKTDGFDGKCFLISTDGNGYGHPSKETLAKIVTRPSMDTRILAFNYPHSMYIVFSDEDSQQKYNYQVFLDNTACGFEVKEK